MIHQLIPIGLDPTVSPTHLMPPVLPQSQEMVVVPIAVSQAQTLCPIPLVQAGEKEHVATSFTDPKGGLFSQP